MAGSGKRLTLGQLKAEHERLKQCGDDFERLGADKLADRWTIRRIFVEASRVYHPDLHSSESKDFQKLTEEVFMLLSEAERRLRRSAQPGISRRSRTKSVIKTPAPRAKTPKSKRLVEQKPLGTPTKATNTNPAAQSKSPATPSSAVPKALLRRMGIDSESASTVENPSPGLEQSSSGPSPETRYEEALRAMLGSKYQHATEIFLALIAQSPQEIRYQTALELARGHLARNAGRNQEALEYFHRVCVLDGSCADAIQAIQALTTQATDGEEQLLDRLLGDGR